MGDPRFELAAQVRTLVVTLRDLAEYTRDLEEEMDGSDAGEGYNLIRANAVLADYDHIQSEDRIPNE